MNPNEHQLQYPWGDVQPEPGKAQAVADGVKWIRMPLPFALDHINLWLLRDELNGRQGWTIVDCGIARDEVKALGSGCSSRNWTACRCCACWSRTCIPTTSAWRTGCASAGTPSCG